MTPKKKAAKKAVAMWTILDRDGVPVMFQLFPSRAYALEWYRNHYQREPRSFQDRAVRLVPQ